MEDERTDFRTEGTPATNPLWAWPDGQVWFRPLIPRDTPWGDEDLLDPVPEEARGLFGVKVGDGCSLDGQDYRRDEIVTATNRVENAHLLQGLASPTAILLPWYDRQVPVLLALPHYMRIDSQNYREQCKRMFIKGLITTVLCMAGFYYFPPLQLILLIYGMMAGFYPMAEAVGTRFRRLDEVPPAELNRRMVNAEFFQRWVKKLHAPGLISALVVLVIIFLAQMMAGMNESIDAAALVRDQVLKDGEWWRIITTGLMHGGILHILFNGMALYALGRITIALVSPPLLSIVFLVTVVTGSLASLWLNPIGASVGASGGILGCLAFLLVVTIKFRKDLPATLQSNLVQACAVMALLGVVGSSFIDNAAHAGGFLGGVVIGGICWPWLRLAPKKTRAIVWFFSAISVLILAAASGKVLWMMWEIWAK